MKKLELNQMENIQGSMSYQCKKALVAAGIGILAIAISGGAVLPVFTFGFAGANFFDSCGSGDF